MESNLRIGNRKTQIVGEIKYGIWSGRLSVATVWNVFFQYLAINEQKLSFSFSSKRHAWWTWEGEGGVERESEGYGKGRVKTELFVGEVGGGGKRDRRSKRSGVSSFLLILFTEFYVFLSFFFNTLHIFRWLNIFCYSVLVFITFVVKYGYRK